MNFKSKIKCLLEQAVIIIIISIISIIIVSILRSFFISILSFLPANVLYFIANIIKSILIILCTISSVIIITHVFKIRYLDYYDKLQNEVKKDNNKNEDDTKSKEKFEKNRIIIRDPKHSEYKFINGLFKIIIGIIKFFLLCFALFLAFILICLFGSFITSFLIYKTGLLFIGLLITILSSAIITITILLLILNFVFNRKSDKKKIIWSFIISLIVFGIGCGSIFIGTLNFEILEENETMTKVIEKEHEMKDNIIIYSYNNLKINYVESDIDNLKIEYTINELCEVEEHIDDNRITAWTNCKNPTKLVREFLNKINEKKVIPINSDIEKITVYANKTNIEKLKSNQNKNVEEKKHYDNTISSYEKEINRLETENENLKEKIIDLQQEIND